MDNPLTGGRPTMPASLAWPATASKQSVRSGKSGTRKIADSRRRRGWWLLLLLPAGAIFAYRLFRPDAAAFATPVGADFKLSGNFGELRPNHFHMGLDVRTNGEENLPVYAVADGYVSRIVIEEYSLGKAVFVTHPNGYTTVYAHLNRFYDDLQAAVEQQQMKQQQREQAMTFGPTAFPVKKGQLIARSGNTGGSEAPHLHFEMRSSRTGHHVNPLRHGYSTDDEVSPALLGLYWYNRQYSTNNSGGNTISIKGNNGEYTSSRPVIKVRSPRISLAMRAIDKTNDNRFRLGIYRVELLVDGSLLHEATMDDIDEADTRYINACIDYGKWIRSGIFVQHLGSLPGNHLPAWKGAGIINLEDKAVHQLKLRLYDVNNNVTEFNSAIQYSGAREEAPFVKAGTPTLIPGKAAQITGASSKVSFTAKAFYDTVHFVLREQASESRNKASALITLHEPTVPLHEPYTVSIKALPWVNERLRKRTVMQLNNGQQKLIAKGKWKDNWLSANFNTLGTVQLLLDTVPPGIRLVGWDNRQTFTDDPIRLKLTCRDETGGVTGFRATLDGQWLLYEQKAGDFVLNIPPSCKTGLHLVNITVQDIAGNTTARTVSFRKK